MIEADGLCLLAIGRAAAEAGVEAPPKPFMMVMEVEDLGMVKFYMDRAEVEQMSLGGLRLICDG